MNMFFEPGGKDKRNIRLKSGERKRSRSNTGRETSTFNIGDSGSASDIKTN